MNKIKKLIYGLIMSLTMIFMIENITVADTTAPDIIGESAIVFDVETGEALYEKNVQKVQYPASITKVMTALVVLENADLDDAVEFSAAGLYSIEQGSSAAYIQPGEIMTVEESLYVMMLRSANDVAHGLAYYVGGDLAGFAEMMNDKAAELGCTNTHFENASGLHGENHYTTAEDMAKIAKAAYENEVLRKIMGTVIYHLAPTNKTAEERVWTNGNRMIRSESEYYFEPCLGGKTGYTTVAGGTLITYAKEQGRVLSCVVLKSLDSKGTYKDSTALYKYVDQAGLIKHVEPATEEVVEEIIEDAPEEVTLMSRILRVVKIIAVIFAIIVVLVIGRILYVQWVLKKRREELRKKRMQEQKRREEDKRRRIMRK